jgi:hypothetical protein
VAGNTWRTIRRYLPMTVLIVLVTGCSFLGDPVESQWNDREVFPSCGSVELNQGEQVLEPPAREIDCLRDALRAEQGAELSVTYPTVEGDPIRTHYRLTPFGTLQVYEDSTDDAFGDQKWSFTKCATPEWFSEVDCE